MRPNCFFVISPIKPKQFRQNRVNVIHLTWIMSLHYGIYLVKLIKCSSCTCYHWAVRERNAKIYSTLTVASKFHRFEFSWLQSVGILQGKVFKILITDLDELKQRLWTECPSWIMSSLRQPFVSGVVDRSRAVMHVNYTFYRNILTRCNQLHSNLTNLEAILEVG